jgi:asparagine synthase (glutamine-hydrolysing)
MPIATLAERRAECELLCKRFPSLALLPLDRNSKELKPLKLSLRNALAGYSFRTGKSIRHFLFPARETSQERRYYYRIYDFNSPRWRAVRAAAEPYRLRTSDFFEEKVLHELLPGPDAMISVQDGIMDVSGLKTLIGFFLWLKEHA